MTYEQDRAAYEQDATEAMIRMREPVQDIQKSMTNLCWMATDLDPHRPVTLDQIRDVSEAVYRLQLGVDGVKSMLRIDAEADPADNGAKLRRRAASYDRTVKDVLEVLGYQVPKREAPKRKEVVGLFD